MRDKNHLNITVDLITLSNLYKSGVSDKDLLIVKSFLTVLRKENCLDPDELGVASDHRITLNEIVATLPSKEIKELYDEHIQKICSAVSKKYFNGLIKIYAHISNDFIKGNVKELFDEQIEQAFSRKAINGLDAMQPSEITALLNSFCDKQNTETYYNPFAGLGSLNLNLPKHIHYYGEEINEEIFVLGKLRMLVYDRPKNFIYKLTDSIEEWSKPSNRTFDFIAYNPPFNLKLDEKSISNILTNNVFGYKGNANSLILSEIMKLLKPGGTMAFICPNAFLFSNNQRDKALKEHLIKNGYIQKIIALPERILNFTALSVNIIVLKNTKRLNSDIEFIDATQFVDKESSKLYKIKLIETLQLISGEFNKFKKLISFNEIISNDFNLSVNRYVYEDLGISDKEKENLVKLKDLVTPIAKDRVEENQGKLVRIRDLADNAIEYIKSFEGISTSKLSNTANKLKANTLLLGITWKHLKPTLFQGNDSNMYYDFPSIFACHINETLINKDYLILELSKEYIQKQIDQKRSGSVQSRITSRDLLEVEVIVPTLELQKKRIYSYQESVIKEHQTKVKELMLEYGIDVADENSFLRHKIAGTLKNARGSFLKLKQIIEQQAIIDLPELYQYKADPKLESTFLDYLKRIERDLNSIHNAVKAVGVEINLQDIKLEPINLVQFIEDYVEEVKNRPSNNFKINFDRDYEVLKEHKIKEVIIHGDKDLLHQVFNNIIENAERHAFINNYSSNNKIELTLLYDFKTLDVQLDFTNTGNPLPENYSFEAFTRKGSKTGSNSGNGIGGWFINEVMKRHNGKFGFTDETGPEGIGEDYVTTIELTLPIEIKA